MKTMALKTAIIRGSVINPLNFKQYSSEEKKTSFGVTPCRYYGLHLSRIDEFGSQLCWGQVEPLKMYRILHEGINTNVCV